MKSSAQQLTEDFRVSIRDKAKAEMRRKITNRLETNFQLTPKEIEALRVETLEKGSILTSLKQLKFLSVNTDLLGEFLPLVPSLLEIATSTDSTDVLADSMDVLINMTACPGFSFPLVWTPKLMKLMLLPNKMEFVQIFFSNLLQEPNSQLMALLLENKLIQHASKRLNMAFSNSEEESNYLSLMCGIMINSKSLPEELLAHVVQIITQMQLKEREEADWIFSASLASCKQDPRLVRMVLSGDTKHKIQMILESKNSKVIINVLKFLLNYSSDQSQFTLLKESGVLEWLATTWENRHPSVKPLITQLLRELSVHPETLQVPLFQTVFNTIKTFESQKDALRFQIGKLILSLLNNYKHEKAVLSLLVEFGIFRIIKSMVINENFYMILLGIEVLGSVLALKPNSVKDCEALGIHLELERLQKHQVKEVFEWSKYLIDTYFQH